MRRQVNAMAGSGQPIAPDRERRREEEIAAVIVVALVALALILFFVIYEQRPCSPCEPDPPPKTIGILVNVTYETGDTVTMSFFNFGPEPYEGRLEVLVYKLEGSSWTLVWTESPQQTVTAPQGRVFATILYVLTQSGEFDVIANLRNSAGNIINGSNYLSCRFTVTDG